MALAPALIKRHHRPLLGSLTALLLPSLTPMLTSLHADDGAGLFPTPAGLPGCAHGPYRGFGYEWENNDLGMDHSVPSPWTPVRVEGTEVSVWGRKFDYRNGRPWPDGIGSAGSELLARPIAIHLKTDSGVVTWDGAARLGCHADDAAHIRWQGSEAGLAIEVIASLEFDGFLRTDIRLKPVADRASIRELVVDIPFSSEIASFYNRGFSYDFVEQKRSPSWRAELGETAGRITGDRREPFVFHYWIGNERCGAEISIPSNYEWSTAKDGAALEVLRGKEAVTLRLNMVTAPREIAGETTFSFALLPTPIKPIGVKDHRRIALLPSTVTDTSARGLNPSLWRFYPILFHGTLSFETWGLPQPARDPAGRADFDAKIAAAAKIGLNVIPYSAACLMSTNAPGFEKYRSYWVTNDEQAKRGMRDNVQVSLYAKSIRDFLVYRHVQAARSFPFYKGLYFDVADVSDNVVNANANAHDMRRRPDAQFKPVYEIRDFYKRIYKAVKAARPDYLITMHQAKMQDVFAAFVDVMLTGEGLNATFFERGKAMAAEHQLPDGHPTYMPDYAMFSEGFWRSVYVPKGYINVFLPQVTKTFPTNAKGYENRERDWRRWFAAHPDFVTRHSREMLSRTLVLDLYSRRERCDPAIWTAIMRGFEELGGLAGELKHIPYWEATSFAKAESDALLFTAYVRPEAKRAIVICANWHGQPARGPVTLDAATLGLANTGTRKIIDLESKVPLPCSGATTEIAVPANDFRMLLFE